MATRGAPRDMQGTLPPHPRSSFCSFPHFLLKRCALSGPVPTFCRPVKRVIFPLPEVIPGNVDGYYSWRRERLLLVLRRFLLKTVILCSKRCRINNIPDILGVPKALFLAGVITTFRSKLPETVLYLLICLPGCVYRVLYLSYMPPWVCIQGYTSLYGPLGWGLMSVMYSPRLPGPEGEG